MIISPHVFNDNTTTRSCAVWNRPCTAQTPEGRPRFPLSPPPAPNCVTPAVSTTRINSLPGPCGVLRILHAAGPVRTVLDILAVSQHQFPRTSVLYHIFTAALSHIEKPGDRDSHKAVPVAVTPHRLIAAEVSLELSPSYFVKPFHNSVASSGGEDLCISHVTYICSEQIYIHLLDAVLSHIEKPGERDSHKAVPFRHPATPTERCRSAAQSTLPNDWG